MPVVLSKSVGNAGVNKPADVLSVQVNLNRVPQSSGGPLDPLAPDSIAGPLTIGAIRRFQQHHFGWADGRIDPGQKTHQTLNAVVDSLAPLPDAGVSGNPQASPLVWPDPGLQEAMLATVGELFARAGQAWLAGDWLRGLSPARLTTIAVALAETFPRPWGAVSDQRTSFQVDPWDGTLKRIRNEWQKLREYLDVGAPALVNMNNPDHREGVLCWNKREPVS